MKINEKKITRVEIVSKDGRKYVNDKCRIKLELQDEDRTLKIFLED